MNLRKSIRSIALEPNEAKTVFLTFDDGPDPETTPQVLEILKKYQAEATFFLVAQEADKHRKLALQILSENHGIGNHSLDHRYSHFFRSTAHLKTWIQSAEQSLSTFSDPQNRRGFRPPAGIVTPPLRKSLESLHLPLVLWSHRFYDAVLTLSRPRILRTLGSLKSGEIVLLHDKQASSRRARFLSSLDFFIRELKKDGWLLKALPRNSELLTKGLNI